MAVNGSSYRHDHVQDTPSAVWNITHNLNTMSPVVDCHIDIDGAVQKIIPGGVEVIDALNVAVTFSSVRTGTAAIR